MSKCVRYIEEVLYFKLDKNASQQILKIIIYAGKK